MRIGVGRVGLAIAIVSTPVLIGAAAVAPINTFQDVRVETYTHATPAFSLSYPYALRESAPSRKGEVFTVAGPARVPSLNVMVVPRPPGVTLAQAATGAAMQVPNGTVKAQQAIDLGGTPGERVTVDWSMPVGKGVALRSVLVSAYTGDSLVIVTATDGRVGDGLSAELTEAVESLRFPR